MGKTLLFVPELNLYCGTNSATCYTDERAAIAITQTTLYQPVAGMPSLEEWANEVLLDYDANPAVQVQERSWLDTPLGSLPYFEMTVQQVDNVPLAVYQVLSTQDNRGTIITYLVPQTGESYPELPAQIRYTFEHLALLDQE